MSNRKPLVMIVDPSGQMDAYLVKLLLRYDVKTAFVATVDGHAIFAVRTGKVITCDDPAFFLETPREF